MDDKDIEHKTLANIVKDEKGFEAISPPDSQITAKKSIDKCKPLLNTDECQEGTQPSINAQDQEDTEPPINAQEQDDTQLPVNSESKIIKDPPSVGNIESSKDIEHKTLANIVKDEKGFEAISPPDSQIIAKKSSDQSETVRSTYECQEDTQSPINAEDQKDTEPPINAQDQDDTQSPINAEDQEDIEPRINAQDQDDTQLPINSESKIIKVPSSVDNIQSSKDIEHKTLANIVKDEKGFEAISPPDSQAINKAINDSPNTSNIKFCKTSIFSKTNRAVSSLPNIKIEICDCKKAACTGAMIVCCPCKTDDKPKQKDSNLNVSRKSSVKKLKSSTVNVSKTDGNESVHSKTNFDKAAENKKSKTRFVTTTEKGVDNASYFDGKSSLILKQNYETSKDKPLLLLNVEHLMISPPSPPVSQTSQDSVNEINSSTAK